MAKFKVGDRVRRINSCNIGPEGNRIKVGDEGFIVGFDRQGWPVVSGFEGVGGNDPNNLELIPPTAQAVSGAIRTVTRREIVPGVYGRVVVAECKYRGMASAALVDNLGKRHREVNFLDATELREAAHLFNQIAEVLEENAAQDVKEAA